MEYLFGYFANIKLFSLENETECRLNMDICPGNHNIPRMIFVLEKLHLVCKILLKRVMT